MSANWVGFQSMPKAQVGLSIRHLSLNFQSHAQPTEILELLTTATGLSKWLGATAKCQPSLGAKFLTQIDGLDVENVFTAISLPRQIVLLNESLGEIDFQLKKQGQSLGVSIRISRATTDEEFESWRARASASLAKFEGLFSHG